MPQPSTNPVTLANWARRDAIPFDPASPDCFNSAVDRMVAAMGNSAELVALGEPMHGAAEFQQLRNQLFQHLVQAHGFTAIAIESSFPRSRVVNDYINATNPAGDSLTCEEVQETGFSHGFGRDAPTRDLIEWMRAFNTDPAHNTKLRFFGFDSPTEMMWTDSPRRLIEFVLDYLALRDNDKHDDRRRRIAELLGDDAPWENQEAAYDPTKSIGLSPSAGALRLEVEDLASELQVRRPELVTESGEESYLEAVHYATLARQLLTYHAVVARPADTRVADLLGIRDAMMADNLMYILARERGRGRVLAFAHNSHLQRGIASWQFGPQLLEWWPAGAHVSTRLGPRYVNIGVGIGTSESFGAATPEPDTLEAHLTAVPGPGRFIPTYRSKESGAPSVTAIATRTAAAKNPGYFPFTARSLTDFDWLTVLDSIS